MGLHVIDEAKRCLNCKKPRCQEGCPIHTPIPVMIQMLLQGEMPEAAEMVFANNPLSVICSLVCDHEKQCEGHCVKGIKGEPVHISSIENYISDTCFDRMKLEQLPKNGKRIAVVGAGPAGITIAILMACRGYKVTIFEVKEKIGGIMRYGIPEFRLPKSILDRYYVKMKELGILFRPNFALGGSTGVEDLLRDGYHAVFIGTGTWRPYQLHIPGETFGNVHYGINYLNNPDVYDLGERVLVIGAGNAAMDVARTAIRKGSRHVTVYSITEIPAASPKEVEYAKLDGVEFEYLQTAIEIRDENAGNQTKNVLQGAVEFINSHYMDEELSLNTAAHVANVSANHFSALFSQNMGQTFIEYLTSLRMSKARELLRCTAKRSSEIAGEVGYKDAHYFSYLFKKTQGMTPSEYRKLKREEG